MEGDFAGLNADALERALAARRGELQGIETDDDRQRRAEALSHIDCYTALLRQPASEYQRDPVRYSFKLVLPDGRWSIDEKALLDPPSQGDVLVFDGWGGFRIEGSQSVGVRPAGKPPRQFFVCAPAA